MASIQPTNTKHQINTINERPSVMSNAVLAWHDTLPGSYSFGNMTFGAQHFIHTQKMGKKI